MVLYFVLSNSLMTAIQLLWRWPAARKFFKIPTPVAIEGGAPAPGFVDSFMKAFKSNLNEPLPSIATQKTLKKSVRKA